MLEQSMLARDRRREMVLLAVTSVLLLAQLSVIFLPISVDREQIWVNILIGSCSLVFTVIWMVLRSLRLKGRRSFLFHSGMMAWCILGVCAVSFPFMKFGVIEALPLSLISFFFILIGVYSFLGRSLKWRWCREIGWPLYKSIHWVVVIPFILLDYLYLLSSDQVYAFGGVLLLVVYRYSFNRWIYAKTVHYPFKKTAPKFYIKQMRRSK
ncbi:MAG: hypothetical protein VX185_13085 [Pseudomonadota bacterium]|nr:hypothetical protein [Pseudomonadota bacterium]